MFISENQVQLTGTIMKLKLAKSFGVVLVYLFFFRNWGRNLNILWWINPTHLIQALLLVLQLLIAMSHLVSELSISSLALQVLNSMLQQEFLTWPRKQSKYLSRFLVWADDALYSWIAVPKLMSNLFRVESMDFECVQDVNTLMWQQNLKLLLLHVFFSQRPLKLLHGLTLTATYTADYLYFGINNANLQ